MKTITSKIDDPAEFKIGPKTRIVPRGKRHVVSADAMEPRNTKVRVSIYLDLDVLDFFKGLAAEPQALPYQTQINAALRNLMDSAEGKNGPAGDLRKAKGLIDAALRKI